MSSAVIEGKFLKRQRLEPYKLYENILNVFELNGLIQMIHQQNIIVIVNFRLHAMLHQIYFISSLFRHRNYNCYITRCNQFKVEYHLDK